MNNDNTYYERNKERLQEQLRNCYHQKVGKEKQKTFMKLTKNNYKSKHKIKIENYLMMKKIEKANMK